ncbi:MAG: hypothetical protein QF903_14750 [Planctomycetota bacterium]|nr:hypothetical protein [Planctomycetota bacterium]MDP6761958.1 hypothetical protein [Planctomycetota bacterium]MDP6990728.1 hypothetical protein [Planctomycetota bacterium]
MRPSLSLLLVLAVAWIPSGDRDGRPARAHGSPATPPAASAPAAKLPEEISYAQLGAHPGRYLGRCVRVRVQVSSWAERWDPFLTRFGSGEFRALDAWSDEQRLWDEAEFAAPAARLFVRRGSAAEWALAEARRFDRFELELEVHAVLADRPWAQVSCVRPLAGGWSEGALIHAARAADLVARGASARAREELDRALRGPLHPSARRALGELVAADG